MTPLQALQSILNNNYESEDGDSYKAELLPGLSAEEINTFKQSLPREYLPQAIEELLLFSRGFELLALDTIEFAAQPFGQEDLFPYSIELAGDGFGNFWVLDIDSKGNWGNVYYACHDPAVIVKHSENLAAFILDIDEFARLESESKLGKIHEQGVSDICNAERGIIELNTKDDYDISAIADKLPEVFMIADLTNAKDGVGFAWGKYGANAKIVRFGDEPIWAIEKKKKGFMSKLFG